MTSVPVTPSRPRVGYMPETPQGGTPVTARVAGSSINPASPAYITTRRHSLYGTEDRIVLDLGSRIWRVGFSGEGRPRDVFLAGGEEALPLWTLERAADKDQREEEARLLEARIQHRLRSVFHEYVDSCSFLVACNLMAPEVALDRPKVPENLDCGTSAPPIVC
jgi:actin-related protein 10